MIDLARICLEIEKLSKISDSPKNAALMQFSRQISAQSSPVMEKVISTIPFLVKVFDNQERRLILTKKFLEVLHRPDVNEWPLEDLRYG